MDAQKRKFYAKLMQVDGQIDGQNLDAHRFSQAAYGRLSPGLKQWSHWPLAIAIRADK